ncbi:MAG TPA: type II toxin-antitoxin system PrlF family antitoxin [Xanthobacteraceae bacterium]|nr:type II toxin-antitoxin system PrlF family antitoxin [Xanthobacteraceae bacterium]
MDEIVAATGGPQYNVLRRLEGRGYRIRKMKKGKATRYFASPPAAPFYEATVTGKGQITLPKEVRERLHLSTGNTVRFTVEEGGRVAVARGGERLRDLFGILGKPPRSATLKQMDQASRRGAVDRYLRAVGGKKR